MEGLERTLEEELEGGKVEKGDWVEVVSGVKANVGMRMKLTKITNSSHWINDEKGAIFCRKQSNTRRIL